MEHQLAEYFERARRFEQLAAEEEDLLLKAELERQAKGQRLLADVTAKQLGIPLSAICGGSD